MNLTQCTEGQREVVTTLDAPLMVAAGAGSGKTFTLTQRIVNAFFPHGGSPAVLSSIDEVLAITFTRKAAAELRSRVKSLLEKEGLHDQALAVENAWVLTISSMAARILREHALEVGLDPAFEVISESLSQELRAQAVDQVVLEAEQADDEAMRKLLASAPLFAEGDRGEGIMDRALALLARVYAMPNGFNGLVIARPSHTPGELMRSMISLGEELQGVAGSWSKPTDAEKKCVEPIEQALEQARTWLERSDGRSFEDPSFDADAFRRAFYAFPPTTAKFRSKKDDASFFEGYRSEYARLAEEVELSLSYTDTCALVRLARLVDERFAAIKGRSRLDNADLLRRCVRMLEEHPAIAQSYRGRFKLVMIDEFQDTDKLQVALIGMLSQPAFGNVCTVGDAQQSIYRFRGADVNVFFEYRDALERRNSRARFVSLPDNFRSHADVLALVDKVFSQPQVFGEEFLRLEPKAKLNKEHDPLFDGVPRVALDFVHYKAKRGRTPGVAKSAALAFSARRVARHFAQLAKRGAKAGDMALLLGGMKNAAVYARALREEGLESVITGGSVFSSSAEAVLVGALLRWAVNGRDDEALFTVLTSALFALSDDALLFLATDSSSEERGRSRRISAGLAAFSADEAIHAGLSGADAAMLDMARTALSRFASCARRTRAAEALRGILVDTGLLDRLEREGASGLASAGNYAKAISLVAGFEKTSAGIASVSDAFAEHVRTSKEAPGALAAVESDFVRIMTVHSSKGLQFPHVAIAELGKGSSKASSFAAENIGDKTFAALRCSEAGPFAKTLEKLRGFERADEPLAVEDAESPGQRYRSLVAHAAAQTLGEAYRLLYVALTRASKSLLLSWCTDVKPEDAYEKAGIYRSVYEALGWDLGGAECVSEVDYGGSAPAHVVLSYLAPGDKRLLGEGDETAEVCGCGAEADDESGPGGSAGFDASRDVGGLAEADERTGVGAGGAAADDEGGFVVFSREPVKPAFVSAASCGREDVRSYTSLAKAAKGEAVAASHAATCDDWARNVKEDVASVLSTAEEYGDGRVASAAGADDATALGTAFHLLAQRAIEEASAAKAGASRTLVSPDDAAVKAQVARGGLSPDQERRLRAALARWFSSDEARALAGCAHLGAEVPFMVRAGASSFYLEGEIDALAYDDLSYALVVDYKTGGAADETPEGLHEKHLLQAQCYAYALLDEGFAAVEARFVRVEQQDGRYAEPRPQAVVYRFGQTDRAQLDQVLAKAFLRTV